MIRKNSRRRIAAPLTIATVLTGVVLLDGVTQPASAEGGYTSYIQQAQPSFSSRFWADNNNDGNSTIVTLSGCKANGAGQAPGSVSVRSVTVVLKRYSTVVGSITKACGTYNFGRTPGGAAGASNGFHFEISEINGATSADRTVFLDASSASVSY